MIELRKFNVIIPLTKWALEELNKDGVINLEEEELTLDDGVGHFYSIKNEEPLNQTKYTDKMSDPVKCKWRKVEDLKDNLDNLIALTKSGYVFGASYRDGIWYKVNEKKEAKEYKKVDDIIGWMEI